MSYLKPDSSGFWQQTFRPGTKTVGAKPDQVKGERHAGRNKKSPKRFLLSGDK